MLKQTVKRITSRALQIQPHQHPPQHNLPSTLFRQFSSTTPTMRAQKGTITSITETSPSETKWLTLQKIHYTDQNLTPRIWEVASRKTRDTSNKGSNVDAVAICPILLRPNKAAETVLVLQYRPPVDAITVEWPAGLVDAGESVEDAAVRELREEVGYKGNVVDVSPILVADPGMSSANMRVVTVEVEVGEEDEVLPEQQLDEGEMIERVVVGLGELYEKLVEYSKREGFVVSAKLFHWAAGLHAARTKSYL